MFAFVGCYADTTFNDCTNFVVVVGAGRGDHAFALFNVFVVATWVAAMPVQSDLHNLGRQCGIVVRFPRYLRSSSIGVMNFF